MGRAGLGELSWAAEEVATSAAHPGKSRDLPTALLLPPLAAPHPWESGAVAAAPTGTRWLTPLERWAAGTELELPAWSEGGGRTACLREAAGAERPSRRPGSHPGKVSAFSSSLCCFGKRGVGEGKKQSVSVSLPAARGGGTGVQKAGLAASSAGF